MRVHLPGRRKNFGAKFTGKICKYTPTDRECPPRQSKSPFLKEIGEIWAVKEVI